VLKTIVVVLVLSTLTKGVVALGNAVMRWPAAPQLRLSTVCA
jgi:hypothetical protein